MKKTHSFAPSFNLRRANQRRASGDPYILYLGNDDEAYGQCQEVEFLDLRGVDISPECAAEIYARRENKWKKFKVDKTFNVIMELFSKYDVQSFKTNYVSFSPDELDEIKYESYVQSALVLAPGIFFLSLLNSTNCQECRSQGCHLQPQFCSDHILQRIVITDK